MTTVGALNKPGPARGHHRPLAEALDGLVRLLARHKPLFSRSWKRNAAAAKHFSFLPMVTDSLANVQVRCSDCFSEASCMAAVGARQNITKLLYCKALVRSSFANPGFPSEQTNCRNRSLRPRGCHGNESSLRRFNGLWEISRRPPAVIWCGLRGVACLIHGFIPEARKLCGFSFSN